MYGDVNITIEDGNLGRAAATGRGVQFKVGVSHMVSTVPILITGNMNAKKIKEKLGYSPLADACLDSVEWGAEKIYCIPVIGDIQGTLGTIRHTGKGTGNVSITGTPNNSYEIIIEIVTSGNINAGTLRYSIDGGNSYTDECTIPLTGNQELMGTGLKAVFTDGSGSDDKSFVQKDRYLCTTTAPSVSNQKVITAVESLINNNTAFEFIHIVGTSSKALWASLVSLSNDFASKYKRPIFFVCEGRNKTESESLDDYLSAMEEERKGISTIYLQVVLSYATYQRIDGRTMDINTAGIITGLYCQAKESQSIGEVKSFPISSAKMLRLLPEGIEDYIKALDELKYLTIRQYVGKEDYFVTSANMMSPEGSDYQYAEDVRVLNRIVKAVRQKALDELQMEIDPGALESGITVIQEELGTALDDAIHDRIISSGQIAIDTENLNILADETMDIRVVYVPMGHIRVFNITFAVENPYSAS